MWLEARCIFNRSLRASELREFNLYWQKQELETLAARLATREFLDQNGFIATWWATRRHRLPQDMVRRARVYQWRAERDKTLDKYRSRLGLPPRHALQRPPPP
jgi:hypothetical protein